MICLAIGAFVLGLAVGIFAGMHVTAKAAAEMIVEERARRTVEP
jgi:uncharacterized membrane protein YczE